MPLFKLLSPKIKNIRYVHIYGDSGKQKLCQHLHSLFLHCCTITTFISPHKRKLSEGNPEERHLRKARYGKNVVTRQLQLQQCHSDNNTHKHKGTDTHTHCLCLSQCNQDSLGEKSATNWRMIFLTLHWGEGKLGSQQELDSDWLREFSSGES